MFKKKKNKILKVFYKKLFLSDKCINFKHSASCVVLLDCIINLHVFNKKTKMCRTNQNHLHGQS